MQLLSLFKLKLITLLFEINKIKKMETQTENLVGLQNNSDSDDDQETSVEPVITKMIAITSLNRFI